MKKAIKNKLSNILLISFIFSIIVVWLFSGWPQIWQRPAIPPNIQEAKAAATFVAAGTARMVGSGNMTSVGIPAGIQNNDILIVVVHSRDNVNSTMPTDWTQKVEGNGNTTNRLEVWWKRTSGTESAPTVTHIGGNSAIARMYAFRGVITSGDPFDVVGIVQNNSGSPISTAAIITTINGDMILHLFGSQDDNNWGSFTGIAINDTGVQMNTAGNDDSLDLTYGVQINAGSTGLAGATQTARGPDAGVSVQVALKPAPITTLGDGADPGNSTVAPGSTNQYLGQFTFVTSAGTDSVTALTVTTANTVAIASMQIWNNALTVQYFGTVSTPAGNSWNFSGGTPIPVTTSQAAFRVIFTAKNHVSLAPGTYPVTGTVTSFTCTSTTVGTDIDSAIITIDNSPPAGATWETIIPGDSQIILNWINPGDADFNKVVILRKTNSAVTDAPTDGTEYNVNDAIGLSTVRYVGNGTTFTDTGLTNGTNYYYKIFAYDTYINYAAGLGTGPHTPQANVIIVGTNGSQTPTMNIPSTNNYVGGAFTFIRNTGTANVTQITITETGTVNAYTNLSNVKLYYDIINCTYDGTEPQYGLTGSFDSSAKATFNGNVSVGTSQVCFYVFLDVDLGALNGQTLEVEISNPSTEVTVSTGNVSPVTPVAIAGTTTFQAVIASWRENLDTPTSNVSKNDNIRLRIELANTGGSGPADYRLEYAPKNVTCGSFIPIPTTSQFTNQHFLMSTSPYVADGQNTTAQFPNTESYTFDSGKIITEPSNSSGIINLPQNHYTEIEFVFKPTNNAVSGAYYCFRITNNGISLDNYAVSPELQITP